jgi:hypothetical protein
MSEHVPFLPPSMETPYQTPTLAAAQQRLLSLEENANEAREAEFRLSELQTEANELLSQLGRSSVELTTAWRVSRDNETEQRIAEQEEEACAVSLSILDSINLAANVPTTIKRKESVNLEQAGGYTEYRNFVVQTDGETLFIERSLSNTRYADSSQTLQYIVSKNMSQPLLVKGDSENTIGKAFLLESAKLCGWREFSVIIEEAFKELEADQLATETMEILVDTPLVPSRYRDEVCKTRRLTRNDRSIEIIAHYHVPDDKDPSLTNISIVQYINGERDGLSTLHVREGTFGTYIGEEDDSSRKTFKKQLGIAKFMLEQGAE